MKNALIQQQSWRGSYLLVLEGGNGQGRRQTRKMQGWKEAHSQPGTVFELQGSVNPGQLLYLSCYKKYILVHNLGQMISIGSRNYENTLKICYFGLVSEISEAILYMNIELLLVNISGREMRNLQWSKSERDLRKKIKWTLGEQKMNIAVFGEYNTQLLSWIILLNIKDYILYILSRSNFQAGRQRSDRQGQTGKLFQLNSFLTGFFFFFFETVEKVVL